MKLGLSIIFCLALALSNAGSQPPLLLGKGRGEGRPAQTPHDLTAAIEAAKTGDTIHVQPGTYAAPIKITKSISLIADRGATLEGKDNGDVVIITAPNVTLKNLTLRHTGIDLDHENAAITIGAANVTVENCKIEDALFGISLRDAANCRIVNNDITGKDLPIARRGDAIKIWNSPGTLIEGNHITGSRDLVLWYSQHLTVRKNVVENCRYGIHCMYASDAVVTDNVLRDNSVGIFLMYGQNLTLHRNIVARNRGPSGFGLGLKDIDGVDAHDNAFVDNRVGLHVDNSPSRFDLTHVYRRNLFANNDIALGFMPNVRNNEFTENTFFDNIQQVAVFGGGNTSTNTFAKNYWSDYRGYDANNDGIGDVPHRSQSIFENLMDRDSRMRLFLFSPAQQAIDLASRAFPICKPQLRATDQAPLMAPMAIELPKENQHTLPASVAGLALLATGGSFIALARKSFGANHERATH